MFYLDVKLDLAVAIYTCMRLYSILDEWKDSYNGSDLYKVSKQFLEARGML